MDKFHHIQQKFPAVYCEKDWGMARLETAAISRRRLKPSRKPSASHPADSKRQHRWCAATLPGRRGPPETHIHSHWSPTLLTLAAPEAQIFSHQIPSKLTHIPNEPHIKARKSLMAKKKWLRQFFNVSSVYLQTSQEQQDGDL